MIEISLEQFREAERLIQELGLVSPVIRLPLTRGPKGQIIFLKCENLQPSGSFKIRGASYTISRLDSEERGRGVVAFSTGNHAQAVALAAKLQGIRATIVMPSNVPVHKLEATKRYGAEVILSEPSADAAKKRALSLADEKGYVMISPYDHRDVITGQGTIGLELVEQVREFGSVFVPIGGGGLISGIAMAVKKLAPFVKVIGVEPELENHAAESFRLKRRVHLAGPSNSIADAIKIQSLGDLTYPLVLHYVDDVITVSEEKIRDATLLCAQEGHLIVEPGGALSVAGALAYGKTPDKPIVCVACGGNMTLEFLSELKTRAGGSPLR
jgi:threonine dehydratase